MTSISPGVLDATPAFETVRLALASLSPVEAAALTLAVVVLFVVVARFPRRPVVSLNERNAAEAGLAPREVTR